MLHDPVRSCPECPPVRSRRAGACDDAERRKRILDAASAMLAVHGYHATSMDSVASASGMSKKTLYQFFGSKRALFETLILERLFTPIDSVPRDSDPLEQQLRDMLVGLADHLFDEERLGLLKTIITEASRNPAVRQLVTDMLHLSGHSLPVGDWLAKQAKAGRLRIEEIDEASDMLFGMTLGGTLLDHLTHCRPPRDRESLLAFIERGIQVFLAAHRP